MNANTITLTNDTFESEVLNSDIPVVVDFWAAWCGPCRLISPIVETLGVEFAGRAKVAKLNVDDYPKIASRYNIQAVPTLLFFHQGQLVDAAVGVAPKHELAQKLNALLNGDRASSQAA